MKKSKHLKLYLKKKHSNMISTIYDVTFTTYTGLNSTDTI